MTSRLPQEWLVLVREVPVWASFSSAGARRHWQIFEWAVNFNRSGIRTRASQLRWRCSLRIVSGCGWTSRNSRSISATRLKSVEVGLRPTVVPDPSSHSETRDGKGVPQRVPADNYEPEQGPHHGQFLVERSPA